MNFSGTKPHGKLILFSISYSTASGCCFSLVSYIKDRKKQQFTFKKGVNNKPPLERHASVNFLK